MRPGLCDKADMWPHRSWGFRPFANLARCLLHQLSQNRFARSSAMIVLTDSAVHAVRTAIDKADTTSAGLRIQVEAGGCAGYKYMMGLVGTPDDEDAVVSSGAIGRAHV